MSRIGVLTALATEARALGARTSDTDPLTALQDGTPLLVSGIGFEAAARAAEALLRAGATGLVNIGLAGGLDPDLPVGAVVLPLELRAQGQVGIPVDDDWHHRVMQALASNQPVATGSLCSSRTAVVTVEAKRRLFAESGAAAVDMEGWAVAQIAMAAGVPFLAIKVVVDTATDTLPRAVMAVDGAGRVRAMKLAGTLLRYPNEIGALIRLAGRYGAARRSLRSLTGVSAWRQPIMDTPTRDIHV